jgi:2-methylcitrate dehydratase PrpD
MHPFDAAEIASIEADVVRIPMTSPAVDAFGPKTNVHTKEDADHSLPYLLAVALTAMSSRLSSSPNGLRSRMSKVCSSKSL